MPTYVVTGPDGTKYRVTAPEGATEAEVMARVQGRSNKPTSFWQGLAEGITKPAANAARMMVNTNPILNAATALFGAPRVADIAEKQANKAYRASNHRGSTAGKITGEVLGTLPTALLPGAGAAGAAFQGAAGGAMLSNMDDPRDVLRNAAAGGVGGVIGQQVGKRVIAPVAERIGRTAPARAIARRLATAASKATGRDVAPLPAPLTRAERTVSKAIPNIPSVAQNLDEASRMGLPYSLADADPKLRQLAGSVGRFSPDGRALAEANYSARTADRGFRAIQGVDDYLAPSVDVKAASASLRKAAREAADPLYKKAFAHPAPVDDELSALLQTPAGSEALKRAKMIAANEGKDITANPTFETLDYVKRGLDSVLGDKRNAFGKLDLEGDPVAASVNDVLHRFKARLDQINPDYAQARATYADLIKPRTALNKGFESTGAKLPARDLQKMIADMSEEELAQFRAGYATNLTDQIANAADRTNPYDLISKGINRPAKLEALYPEGADQFQRLRAIEAEMAKTSNEVLGGSQTQPRAVQDAMFQDGILGDMVDGGIEMMTGGGIPRATKMLGAVAQKIKDRSNIGLVGARKKADALAPVLFGTDPRAAQSAIEELIRRQAEQEIRKKAYQRSMGLLAWPGTVLGVAGAGQFP